ncbi:MAG: hypothetical protein M1831_006985 [Alyxoria varia]|nr:MAG: hypothetical protein M1831_006985 [Alyxoria varia]
MQFKAPNAFVLGVLASLAGPAAGFWRMSCPSSLITARMDPIIDPGKVSGHVHTIAGGSGFGYNMTYQQARDSKCSTCPIEDDLSNYWTPLLYFRSPKNGSFTAVPQAGASDGGLGGMTVYYQQRPGPKNDKLHAFPEGFRMVAGNPFKRKAGSDFASKAVSFACLDYNGPPSKETNQMPNRNCPDGLRAQVYFPSCWDGRLDSEDHHSHVAYPESGDYNNGPCPASHPKHLISIFYEVIYQTGQFAGEWEGDQHPFVFAMGDPDGAGYHGDFVNGWDVDLLQRATDDCTNDSGNVKDCEHFKLIPDEDCRQCRLPAPTDEDVKGPMPELPGCNPVRKGEDVLKPVKECKKDENPNASAPSGNDKPSAGHAKDGPTYQDGAATYADLTQKSGYKYLGCAKDSYNSRTLTGADNNKQGAQTVESCVAFCKGKGFKYAGLEYKSECYCGNAVAKDRAPKEGVLGSCTQKCDGDEKQICGGSGALSLYKKCAEGEKCENAGAGLRKRHAGRLARHKFHATPVM